MQAYNIMTLLMTPLARPPPESISRDDLLKFILQQTTWRAAAVENLQNEISQLLRLQNSVAPVNRLAPEIFVEIFKRLVDPTIFKFGRLVKVPSGETRVTSLISATHVCQHWREIALGAATLWTAFPLRNSPLAAAFISRSRSLPLDLDLVLLPEPEKAYGLNRILRACLTPQIPRLRTLILRVRDFDNLHQIVRSLQTVAPKLEELLIWQTRVNPMRQELLMVDPSRPLFGGELPSLNRFTTVGVNVPLSLHAPSAMVHINIHCNGALVDKALIDLLAQCPGLETLRVTESGWFSSHRGVYLDARRAAVSLPKLKHLNLEFYLPERAAALLHHISVPHTARLRIETAHNDPESEAQFCMFPRNASGHLKFLTGIKRVETFSFRDPQTSQFVLVVRAYHDAASYDDPEVEIKARMVFDMSGGFLGTPWPFDVAQVETLVVSGLKDSSRFDEDGWQEMLAPMEQVKTIRAVAIGQTVASELARHLCKMDVEAGTQQFALCPALSTLELIDVCGMVFFIDKSLKEMVVARAASGELKELELFNVACYGRDSREVAEIRANCGLSFTLRVDEDD